MLSADMTSPVRIYPRLDIADLTTMGNLTCAAFKGPLPVVVLQDARDGDTMLRAVGVQDKYSAFQSLVAKLCCGGGAAAGAATGGLRIIAASASVNRLEVLMLVASSGSSVASRPDQAAFRLLAQMLRAGEDTLYLVYFARDHAAASRGREVLESLNPEDNPMLTVERQVVTSADSLAVSLEAHATALKAHLLVVSMDAAVGGAALGSTAVAVAKKTEFPLLVVKSDLDERLHAMSAGLQAVRDAEVTGKNIATVVKGFHLKDSPGVRALLGVEVRCEEAAAPAIPLRFWLPFHCGQKCRCWGSQFDDPVAAVPLVHGYTADRGRGDGDARLRGRPPAAEARHASPRPLQGRREPVRRRRGRQRRGAAARRRGADGPGAGARRESRHQGRRCACAARFPSAYTRMCPPLHSSLTRPLLG